MRKYTFPLCVSIAVTHVLLVVTSFPGFLIAEDQITEPTCSWILWRRSEL